MRRLVAAVVVVAFATGAAPAAGGEKVAGLFDFLFNPPQEQAAPQSRQDAIRKSSSHKRPKRRAPSPERAQPRDKTPTVRRPVVKPPMVAAAPAPTTPKADQTFFVPILGDSLAVQLEQGLQDAFSEQPEVGFVHKEKEASGLARDDYYDWTKAASDLLASKERIDIAIMLLGSNDAQAIHEGTSTYDLSSDKWKEIYARRVADIVKAFKSKNIPLVWVGVPIMRNPRHASQTAIVNDIIRTEVTRAGATFIDSWQAFVNDQGDYSDYGPDATGQRVKLRASDGIHLTRAGARKLALFVEPDIRRTMEKSKPAVEQVQVPAGGSVADIDLPPQPTVDINQLILRELALAARKPNPGAPAARIEARLPVPAPPLEPVLPLKPPAGAVMPLTSAPLSPGGELAATVEKTAATGKITDIVERALVLGLPVDSRPGRSDDFRWPRR